MFGNTGILVLEKTNTGINTGILLNVWRKMILTQ